MKRFILLKSIVASVLFTGLVCISTNVDAQTIRYVKLNGTGNGTSWANASGNIQGMIDASAKGDQVWIAAGTYLLNTTLEMKEGVNIYGGFYGDETNINARAKSDLDGNGTIEAWELTYATVLDGQNQRRVLNQENAYGYSGIETVYDGFTLTKGKSEIGAGACIREKGILKNCIVKNNEVYVTSTSTGYYGGGGIYNAYGGTITHCLVENNKSTNSTNSSSSDCPGGGICNYSGIVTDSKIIGNIVSDYNASCGGGIVNTGIVHNCIISGNTAINNNGYPARGGGIYGSASTSAKVTNCIISGNTATCTGNASSYGGGLFIGQLVEDCIIENNTAKGSSESNVCVGGGICGDSNTTLNRCIIRGNSATEGGGVYNITVTNCLIVNNSAAMGGGSAYRIAINCTYSGNMATISGGAIYDAYAYNCIFWNNSAPMGEQVGGEKSIQYSAVQGGYPGEGNITLAADNMTGGPMFLNPVEGNYRLQEGSPCIDVGNNDAFAPYNLAQKDFDLDGNLRIWNNIIDMGAYEYGSVGIPHIAKNDYAIKVYPNPTTGELRIDNGQLTIKNVEVFDIYGRKQSSHHLITSSSHHLINISHLSAGIYFLRIDGAVAKIVKQ